MNYNVNFFPSGNRRNGKTGNHVDTVAGRKSTVKGSGGRGHQKEPGGLYQKKGHYFPYSEGLGGVWGTVVREKGNNKIHTKK
jgi:hypothetical protein